MRRRHLLLLVLLLSSEMAWSEEPLAPPSKTTTYEHLRVFGEHVEALAAAKDNVFVYADERKKLQREAEEFTDAALDFSVQVKKVTEKEVEVEVSDAGRTRVVLRHEQPPYFGNLETVTYFGPPSAALSDLFSKPVALRIGTEIDLELARKLRKGDTLPLSGHLKSVNAYTESIFKPVGIAVINRWKVKSSD